MSRSNYHTSRRELYLCETATMLTTKRMGWLRLVGSLKLHVSFAKDHYKTDEILQKRPIILRSLLILAAPCHARHELYIRETATSRPAKGTMISNYHT